MCLPGIVQTSIRSICLLLERAPSGSPPERRAPAWEKLPLPIKDRYLRRTACARRACSPIFEATSRRKRSEFIARLTAAAHPSDIAPCSSV